MIAGDEIEEKIVAGNGTRRDYAESIARLALWASRNGSIGSHGIVAGAIDAIQRHGADVMRSQWPNTTAGYRNCIAIQPATVSMVVFSDSTYNFKKNCQNRLQADSIFGNKVQDWGGFKGVYIEVEMGATFRTLVHRLKGWVQRINGKPREIDSFIILSFSISDGAEYENGEWVAKNISKEMIMEYIEL